MPHRLTLLTCSMAADLEIFALLAASVDRHVDPDIRHRVVVPGADVAAFRRFASSRRDIIAQEDVLPVRLWKLPRTLRHLSFLREGFRRPIYLTARREVVRGWMLQQLIKIGMTRDAGTEAVMHVDSDVAFFRSLTHADAFEGDRVRYFRTEGTSHNPMHRAWVEGACRLLGVPPPARHDAHYIENCVLWSRRTLRGMADRIEATAGRPLHEVVFRAGSLSEYYIYGVYADLIARGQGLAEEPVSFCNSYWPGDQAQKVDLAALRDRLQPKHRAIAIQSTHRLSPAERARIYRQAERSFAA